MLNSISVGTLLKSVIGILAVLAILLVGRDAYTAWTQYQTATRSAAGRAPAVVELPRDARFVTLILNFPPQPAGATLVVDLVDARGERVWTRETRTTRVTASVNLTLSRRSVPPGRYAIHVAARTGGTPAPVARYDVQIRHADEGTAR